MLRFLVHRRGLIIQLVALIIFPMLVLLMVVAYGGVSLHEHAMLTLVSERDERAVRAAADVLADRFAQRRLALQILANRLSDGVTLTRILDEQPELRRAFDGGLIAVNRQGEVVTSWQPGVPWASSLRNTTSPWVLDHDSNMPMVVANAKNSDGKLTLFGGISLISLNVPDTMRAMQNNLQTRLYLIADDGHILEDTAGTALGKDAKDWPALGPLFTEQNRGMDHPSGDVVPNVVTVSSRIDGLNWTLVVQEPWVEVVNPQLRLSLVAPLAMIPAVLLAMGILAFGIVNVVQPLRRLGRAATRLTWGSYEAIWQPVGGVQEIRDLQTTLSHMAQRLQQAQAGIHSYIGAMLQGQEDERKRLARELHDDTLQSLIALDQQRQMVQRTIQRDPAKALGHLDQLRVLLDQMSSNLRRLLRDMRPSYIEDLGLTPALEMLSTQTTETSHVPVSFTSQGRPRRLLPDQELSLYRIAQEGISNALRYANATRIEVNLQFEPEIVLKICDNGRGFTIPERPGTFAQAGHYGLMGMVERSEQIGAQFEIDSVPGRGTKIAVRLASEIKHE
jgi:signal transduction histidine kinase